MATLRFLHFSDVHLGVDTVGPEDPVTHINGRVMDYLETLDAMIDFAQGEKIHLALCAGDAFHRSNPNPIYLNEFARRMVRLRAVCPIVMVIGNHDMLKSDRTSTLQLFNVLQVNGIVVGDKPKVHVIPTEVGQVQVTTMPYPTRHLLSPKAVKGKLPEQVMVLLQDKVSQIINQLADEVDDAMPSIFLGHFTVADSQFGSERGFADFSEAEVNPADLLDPVWDYVALGHIHMFQDLREIVAQSGEDPELLDTLPPVVYAGSMERVTFNEEKEQKGFIYGEIVKAHEGYNCSYEFIDLNPRGYVTLEIKAKVDPTREMLARIGKSSIEGAVVRVIIHVDEADRGKVQRDRIITALEQAGMYCLSSFQIMTNHIIQTRFATEEFNSSMTPTALLSKYLEGKVKPGEIKPIVNKAKEIIKEVDSGR